MMLVLRCEERGGGGGEGRGGGAWKQCLSDYIRASLATSQLQRNRPYQHNMVALILDRKSAL